jgi:hypothetical protein
MRDLHVTGERDFDIGQSALRVHVAQGSDAVDDERVNGNGLLESLHTAPLENIRLILRATRASDTYKSC